MQELTFNRLAASAYRTLGLSASASQSEVNQAARRLRIWPDPHSVPSSPWDCEWLGPVRRSKNDIEQALSRINEPATRVEERLLWFHGSDAAKWDSAAAMGRTLQSLSWATDPISKHDFALGRLFVALSHDPGFSDADRWQRVLTYLDELTRSDDYLAEAIQIESNGEFEKRAQLEEIGEAIKALPHAVAGSIAAKAEAALEDDDVDTSMRILGLLRTAAPQSATDCELRIADRLEDLIVRRCNHLHEDLDKIGNKAISAVQGQAICGGRAKFYNESIDPVLTQLQEVAGPHSDRTHRARTAVAQAMAHMGQCWAMCGRMQIAEQTLEAALVLGEGTPVEQAIRENLERCRAALRRSSAPRPAAAAPSVHRGQSYTPTYAVPKKTKSSYTTTGGGSGGWRGAGILIGVVVAIVRGIAGFSGSSSSTNTPSYTYPTYNSRSYNSPTYQPQNYSPPTYSPPTNFTGMPSNGPGNNPYAAPTPPSPPNWPTVPNPSNLEHNFPPLPGTGGSFNPRSR